MMQVAVNFDKFLGLVSVQTVALFGSCITKCGEDAFKQSRTSNFLLGFRNQSLKYNNM